MNPTATPASAAPNPPQNRTSSEAAPADLARARRLRRAAVPLFLVAGFVLGTWALFFTGAAAPTILNDSGPLGRFGLPVAEFLFDSSMAVTIGALVLACTVVPRVSRAKRVRHKDRGDTDSAADTPDVAWSTTLRVAEVASIVWTLAAIAVLVLSFVDTAGAQAFKGNFSGQLWVYVSQVASGRMWAFIIVDVAIVSMLVFAVRSYTGIGLVTLLAFVALVPQALMGHAAEASGHIQAVNSIGLHLLAVTVWLGGLIALAFLSPVLTRREDLGELVRRYSALAFFGFVLIVYSGLENASLRVGGLAGWSTPYGILILLKLGLTCVLGFIGFWHRSFVIARLGGAVGTKVKAAAEFWRLLGVETLIFGAVMGLGVVLSRSQPPIPDEPPTTPTPAEILTNEPLPPYPSWHEYFTQWNIDPLWFVVCVGLSIAYIAAFVRLRRRGDTWPVFRLVMWLIGMALLFYVTCGGPMVYGMVLFSGHMIQHMLLVMAVPLPMVFGAPITLLMRAVKPRTDGSRGFREWILLAVHSHYLRFFAHPIVAAINFAGSLVFFYYSGIMHYALEYHLGHELMTVHFLLAGYLFAQSLVGIDPGVNRYPYPIRFVVLLITMAFHAFFGISIMSSTSLIEGDWFGNMGHGWFPAIDDQQLGGSIAWGIGEFPTLILAIGVAVQWSRSSDREAKRKDRSEARTGDAELRAYNEMLARLNQPRRVPAAASTSGPDVSPGAEAAAGSPGGAVKESAGDVTGEAVPPESAAPDDSAPPRDRGPRDGSGTSGANEASPREDGEKPAGS